ncbi:unnamed protein product [Nyctereutes procyonoides]|uniref:(raccoon dog) hypothetical protein n=1 Tax=Nyctereutes procyonoides TaxID=34880 RepID=A0A811ZY27_NYCPR|nr:unnamed protein product [Nyctereutes procyonoides]
MIVTERERERGRDTGRGRSRLHAPGARCGIRSRVSRIAPWAKGRRQTAKQNQQQPPPLQQPLLPEREETGDKEDGSPIGPPSHLGSPPMANGKPDDPKSALHRGPPGSRGPMTPPLLSLPPPPRGRGPIQGGLGPRCNPYGHGWWRANTEPPFPGPVPKEAFTKSREIPEGSKVGRSLIKNTCLPKDGPQVMEDKSNHPDLCAFYHPGVNGPPL